MRRKYERCMEKHKLKNKGKGSLTHKRRLFTREQYYKRNSLSVAKNCREQQTSRLQGIQEEEQ